MSNLDGRVGRDSPAIARTPRGAHGLQRMRRMQVENLPSSVDVDVRCR